MIGEAVCRAIVALDALGFGHAEEAMRSEHQQHHQHDERHQFLNVLPISTPEKVSISPTASPPTIAPGDAGEAADDRGQQPAQDQLCRSRD